MARMVVPNGSESFVEKLRIVIRNQPIAFFRLLRLLRQGEGCGYRESGTGGSSSAASGRRVHSLISNITSSFGPWTP